MTGTSYVGTCHLLNEVNPARHSQFAAAVCTEQPTQEGGSLSLVVTTLPHAADEYDEHFQRTPELASSMVTTAMRQIHLNSSYHTSSRSNKQSRCHANKQQASHDDDSQNTDEAEAATAAAATTAIVSARAPSPQTNEGRTARDSQAETAIGGKGNKTLAAKVHSWASWTLPDRYTP